MFYSEFATEFKDYNDKIKEKDSVSARLGIDEIIKSIGKTITPFEKIKKDLQDYYERDLILLLSIHYRINALSKTRDNLVESNSILKDIRSYFKRIGISDEYKKKLFELLEANKNSEFERLYSDIEKDADADPRERILTSYAVIGLFFTDLYLTLRQYGELYFKNEGINVNIKLPENTFHQQIPPATIKIYSETDRRAVFVNFKCKDPTAHKIAVLILKDFEKKMNKIEESLRVLGLKLYYLIPRIDKDNYNLENLNFEAYIPTLLPLLTGDNLYNQKEVFIRELIQNSIDAILLREKLESKPFDKTIKIELGYEKNPKDQSLRKYLRITDQGIGMDTFKVERYFTSIGRSFYVSDEFSDLVKNKVIDYQPISNFGIGFLSVFMVCQEVNVITKSYDNEDQALEINIPNYDGCFFINNLIGREVNNGTSITLYEDERKRLDFEETIKYIKDSMLDIQLDIDLTTNSQIEKIPAHSLRINKELVLFLPMDDYGLRKISWNLDVKTGEYIEKFNHGLLIVFDPKLDARVIKDSKIYLNSGIKLSKTDESFFESFYCMQYYNFPASYIQLDVAREKINIFKSKFFDKNEMIMLLAEQANELIKYIMDERKELPLGICDNIYLFLLKNDVPKEKLVHLENNLFYLKIERYAKSLVIKFDAKDDDEDENIINYEFNENFDIINLLLLKCQSLRKSLIRYQQGKISDDAGYNELINKIDEIIEELYKMPKITFFSVFPYFESLRYSNISLAKKLTSSIGTIISIDKKLSILKYTPSRLYMRFYENYKVFRLNFEKFSYKHSITDLYHFRNDVNFSIFKNLDLGFNSYETKLLTLNASDINKELSHLLEDAFYNVKDISDYTNDRKNVDENNLLIILEWYLALYFFHIYLKQVLPGRMSDFKIEFIYNKSHNEKLDRVH